MRTIRVCVLIAALVAMPLAGAMAQNNQRSERSDQWTGFYAKVGIPIGFPDEDIRGSVDIDPGAGFNIAGGYKPSPYFAGEIDINFIAGADVEGSSKDLSIFAFTFNAKGYPLPAFEHGLPEWFQPYGLFGIGGGEAKIGSFDESSFMVRFNVGADFMFWDNIGLYFDTGYLIITDDDTLLKGQGQLVFGGQYRF